MSPVGWIAQSAWKEGAEHCLDAAAVSRMKDDIIDLIKATGNRPPVLNGDATLLDLLSSHAVTTDRVKLSPGEANLRDLGLLREKVKCEQPVAKAEKMLPTMSVLEPGVVRNESESNAEEPAEINAAES